MKTASMLIFPAHYAKSYEKGKEDKAYGKPYDDSFCELAEEQEGYADGYNENKITSLGYWRGFKAGQDDKKKGKPFDRELFKNADHAYRGYVAAYQETQREFVIAEFID
jgi:hypothetical protein